MALPQIAAVAVNYFLFRYLFRRDLPKTFSTDGLPNPRDILTDAPYFRGAVLVLICVLIGYFVGSLMRIEPYVIALGGCVSLLLWALIRRQVDVKIARDISWPLFPFVIGLFVVIRGVENLGLARVAAEGLAKVGSGTLGQIGAAAFGAGLGSNVVNNIPMALLSLSVLKQAHAALPAQMGALLGCNLGPNLTVTGSLATMLVIASARRKGEEINANEFFRVGILATPLLLLAASLALWLTLLLTH